MKIINPKKMMLMGIFLFYIFPLRSQCVTDCVWPGDANRNGIVNHIDFIFAVYAQNTLTIGPIRPNASTDWEAQSCDDWSTFFPNTDINFKHADFDGDGDIEGDDVYWPENNYNFRNDTFNGEWGNTLLGEDLFLTYNNENPQPGDTVIATIHLGSATNVIEDIWAIGFTIELDTALIDKFDVYPNFFGGWLGTPNVDLGTRAKYTPLASDQIDFAGARFAVDPVSGFGPIAEFSVVVIDNISGFRSPTNIPLPFTFRNVYGLGESMHDLLITAMPDTVLIDISTSTHQIDYGDEISLYPNPTKDQLYIDSPTPIDKIEIYNSIGQFVDRKRVFDSRHVIDLDYLNTGIYFIRLWIEDKFVTKKIRIKD